jgi:hypothetical protein
MCYPSRKFVAIRSASLANIWRICALFYILAAASAQADDLFRGGSTDGSKLVLYDASTNTLLPETYSGQSYTQFSLINSATNNQLGASLGIGYDNQRDALYGIDNGGSLYSIDTSRLTSDINHDIGFEVTKIATPGLQISNVKGSAFDPNGLLTISNGSSLYQYNLTTHTQTTVQSSFTDGHNTLGIGGIAYDKTGKLYGAAYSPGSGSIDWYNPSRKKWSKLTSPASFGASSQANVFISPTHLNALYFTNGSNHSYAYDLGTEGTLGLGSILGAGGNLQSFAAVPEPSIGVMVGIGLLGLIGFQRWRRSPITR